ncbi:Exonuclease 3'-5' domain-containing protein 2 [Thoreauomyces humboldtii]|nr:Exonuclease 3'-5' domain-containing protein 2 [Thoreauomyces humboldtii]
MSSGLSASNAGEAGKEADTVATLDSGNSGNADVPASTPAKAKRAQQKLRMLEEMQEGNRSLARRIDALQSYTRLTGSKIFTRLLEVERRQKCEEVERLAILETHVDKLESQLKVLLDLSRESPKTQETASSRSEDFRKLLETRRVSTITLADIGQFTRRVRSAGGTAILAFRTGVGAVISGSRRTLHALRDSTIRGRIRLASALGSLEKVIAPVKHQPADQHTSGSVLGTVAVSSPSIESPSVESVPLAMFADGLVPGIVNAATEAGIRPYTQDPYHIYVIDDAQQANRFLDIVSNYNGSPPYNSLRLVGLDCETSNRSGRPHYHGPPSMVQIAFADNLIYRMCLEKGELQINRFPSALRELLMCGNVHKTGVGIAGDLYGLLRHYKVAAGGQIFDTNVIGDLMNLESRSLAGMLEAYSNEVLDKNRPSGSSYQWDIGPGEIGRKAVLYAANDARASLQVLKHMLKLPPRMIGSKSANTWGRRHVLESRRHAKFRDHAPTGTFSAARATNPKNQNVASKLPSSVDEKDIRTGESPFVPGNTLSASTLTTESPNKNSTKESSLSKRWANIEVTPLFVNSVGASPKSGIRRMRDPRHLPRSPHLPWSPHLPSGGVLLDALAAMAETDNLLTNANRKEPGKDIGQITSDGPNLPAQLAEEGKSSPAPGREAVRPRHVQNATEAEQKQHEPETGVSVDTRLVDAMPDVCDTTILPLLADAFTDGPNATCTNDKEAGDEPLVGSDETTAGNANTPSRHALQSFHDTSMSEIQPEISDYLGLRESQSEEQRSEIEGESQPTEQDETPSSVVKDADRLFENQNSVSKNADDAEPQASTIQRLLRSCEVDDAGDDDAKLAATEEVFRQVAVLVQSSASSTVSSSENQDNLLATEELFLRTSAIGASHTVQTEPTGVQSMPSHEGHNNASDQMPRGIRPDEAMSKIATSGAALAEPAATKPAAKIVSVATRRLVKKHAEEASEKAKQAYIERRRGGGQLTAAESVEITLEAARIGRTVFANTTYAGLKESILKTAYKVLRMAEKASLSASPADVPSAKERETTLKIALEAIQEVPNDTAGFDDIATKRVALERAVHAVRVANRITLRSEPALRTNRIAVEGEADVADFAMGFLEARLHWKKALKKAKVKRKTAKK